MEKIKKILIGTNNIGKYKELKDLLPKSIAKYSPIDFKILSPKETGVNFEQNSFIKASYFSKKTNLICLADDSGLEIDILKGAPGIYSSRWAGKKNDFNLGIKKVFKEISKIKNMEKIKKKARFICCLTLFFPSGESHTKKGIINGQIILKKRGKKGFGYDSIFLPSGYSQTFGEMDPKIKISIDHRYKAYSKLKFFFD